MQTSLKDQINAVSDVMTILKSTGYTSTDGLIVGLNDAASSLSYLNLTKDLESKEEKIKKLIQRKVDGLYEKLFSPSVSFIESTQINETIQAFKELLKEIETLTDEPGLRP